jgi:hypothetical protein
MTPIQIMALIVALIGAIKIIILLTNPGSWMKVVRQIYGNKAIATIAGIVIAGVSLNYLLKVMSIVHVFAAFLFFAGLMMIGFAAYSPETMTFASKLLNNKNFLKKSWLSLIIWIALLAWVLYVLMF